jgi:hypothetical protein
VHHVAAGMPEFRDSVPHGREQQDDLVGVIRAASEGRDGLDDDEQIDLGVRVRRMLIEQLRREHQSGLHVFTIAVLLCRFPHMLLHNRG